MERRLLLSTVAIALVLGSGVASGQTRRPSDQNEQNTPPSTQAQPPQGQMRANPQVGGAAQNRPQPNAPAQNAAPQAPSATTGQAAPQPQPNAPAANNQTRQPAAGPAQTQPQQGQAQQGQTQPGQAQPGMAQQPGNASGTANTAGGSQNGNANANGNANTNAPQNAAANQPQSNQQGVITLSEQQNTRVSTAIRQANMRPLTNVSFSIAVGTAIPADVQLQALPPVLVEILPEYRDYSFVVVEQEVLIIDPNSRAIVAVVPFQAQQTTGANTAPAAAPAPAQAAAPPPPRENTLTRDQREIQRRQAERHRKGHKEKHVIIEERRTTTGAGPREPRVIEERPPVEVYRDGPPVRVERHNPVHDIPLIGPLLAPRYDD
jgi:hypothetical protein